jgi:hypothetical protein
MQKRDNQFRRGITYEGEWRIYFLTPADRLDLLQNPSRVENAEPENQTIRESDRPVADL